jgi:hypothetical protein
MGGREQRGARSFDEGNEQDRPERRTVSDNRDGEAADRKDTDAVGPDHQPPAIPAIRRNPGRQREERQRKHPSEGHGAGRGRRAGHGEHEQRVRDRCRLRPEAG